MPGIRIRLTGHSMFIHALLSKQARCVCGSEDVQAEPGAFGAVTTPLGFSRQWCRACRRHFYLRTSLASDMLDERLGEGEPGAEGLLLSGPLSADDARGSCPTQPLDTLDRAIDVQRDRPSPTDLRALDSYVQPPQRATGSTKRRRRRHEPAAR